jgi:acyl-CoA thioesterase-1
VIVAFGDSLSEGLGVETGFSFPDQLQKKLDKNGYKYHVVNLGVSGDTTTGGLGRLDYALSLKPSIVILELGGNDGLRGVPVASTKANLEKMIVASQKSGASVLLAGMTLPPNYGPDYVRDFEAAYKDLARKYKLRLIPFLMQDILAQLQSQPGLMQRDGIHPTARGHAIIADTVFRYLQPLITRS